MAEQKTAISPRRDEDFPEWYQQVVRMAEIGGKLRRPGLHGHQALGLRDMGRDATPARPDVQGHGTQECLFSPVHPSQLFEKEAQHVEGFAKNAPSLRITGWKSARMAACARLGNWRNRLLCVRHPRRSSARPMPSGCNPIAIADPFKSVGQCRAMGNAAASCSFAQRSSSGRKAIRRTRRKRRPCGKPSKC